MRVVFAFVVFIYLFAWCESVQVRHRIHKSEAEELEELQKSVEQLQQQQKDLQQKLQDKLKKDVEELQRTIKIATETKSPTAKPTTAKPTTAQPTTAKPTTAQPTTAKPTTAQPTTAQPTTAQPTTAQPTRSPIKKAKESEKKDVKIIASTSAPTIALKPATPLTSTTVSSESSIEELRAKLALVTEQLASVKNMLQEQAKEKEDRLLNMVENGQKISLGILDAHSAKSNDK